MTPTVRLGKAANRRSKRVPLRVDISVQTPLHVTVAAETVTVSQHGARIRLTSPNGMSFCTGERLRVVVPDSHATRTARVVWSGRGDAHYGIELDNPTPLWGVAFPALDGDGNYESPGSELPANEALASCGPSHVSQKPISPGMTRTLQGVRVCIMGFSAARSPFSELCDLWLTSPSEATVLLKTPVDPGATLRIRGTSASASTKVRVIGISRKSEGGKWRVRVQSEASLARATN